MITRLASGSAALAAAWNCSTADNNRQRRQAARAWRFSCLTIGLRRFTAFSILLHGTQRSHSSTIQRARKLRRIGVSLVTPGSASARGHGGRP